MQLWGVALLILTCLLSVREQGRQTRHVLGSGSRLRCAYLDLVVLAGVFMLLLHLFHQLRSQVDVGLEQLLVECSVCISLPQVFLEKVKTVTEMDAVLQILDVLF